jgi:hypothetical protein
MGFQIGNSVGQVEEVETEKDGLAGALIFV